MKKDNCYSLFCKDSSHSQTQSDDYIPINKGHYDLDTQERTQKFYKKLSTGWENEYNEYRMLWSKLPKKKEIRDYPLHVDIEMSTKCNLNCPMCYTKTKMFEQQVESQFIDFSLLKKIVDEVAGKIYGLRLSLRGESSLHPDFINAISYAKSKGIKEVSSLTNGSTLDIEFFKKIVEAGIDWLSISIDGTGEEYNQIRKPLKFDETLHKLIAIKKYKEKNQIFKPVIKAQGVWPAIRKNPTLYYNTIAPLVDLVAYNPLIDYLCKDNEIVYEKNFVCAQLYQRLTIASNGNVLLCANDQFSNNIIGNARTQTVHDIWHSDEINNYRKLHLNPNGFKDIYICRECYYPRKIVPNEKVMIGDRKIIIENYINRKQNIGE